MRVEIVLKDILSEDVFKGDVFFNEPMKKHTTLKIGGMADVYAVPEDIISLRNFLTGLKDIDISVTPVGGGSNILVTDGGIEGIVVSVAPLNRIEVISEIGDEVKLFVEAGVPLQRLVNYAGERGYKGIEGLAGIPGLVGGAIRGNAGSFGFEIGDIIESVAVISRGACISMLGAGSLNFGYRSSGISDENIFLSANMKFKKDAVDVVSQRVKDFLHEKLRKQPISERSAGCVFKNPPGASAGKLIDEAHCKGMRRGDVEVSSLHANFFVNIGNGMALDFLGLMDDVKERVLRTFGIELEPEIRIVGRV